MGTLEQASPGRQNAKDWLTLKIVECMSEPMDEKVAGRLETYNAAYNAICQWTDDAAETPAQNRSDASFSVSDAKAWASKMRNADGTTGPHWTMDQAKQIMAQRRIQGEPAQFWAALNMIYSDYCTAIKKANANTIDFYVDMTKAFLDDEGAQDNKLARYYKYIAK